jgi:transposase
MSLRTIIFQILAAPMKLSAGLARLIGMSTAAPTAEPVCTRNAPLPTLEQLPNDPETLQRLVLELVLTLQEERRNREALQQRMALLLRRLYGPRQERFNPDQLLLFAEVDADQAGDAAVASSPPEPDASTASSAKRRRGKPHGRGKPSADLPRRPVHYELSEAERLCSCGQLRVDIGTDVSEQVDWQPASVFVWQHLIHKYLCPHCSKKPAEAAMATSDESSRDSAATAAAAAESATTTQPTDPATIRIVSGPLGPAVVSAVKPAMPIAKGLPGPGLLAQVIVSKYFDHLPLYRQQHIFARQGVSISRSTMCDWMAACAELLRPLYDLMIAAVVQSLWLHTDDTPVKNQGHAPDATATARFWIYAGDRTHPYNVFDFTINRKRDGPQKFLADFHGYLHADAFSGYDALYLPSPRADGAAIKEVACNAHARRKFHEARGSDLLRSHQALAYYGQLYALERAANTNQFDDAQRLQMRQDFAVPILAKFYAWLVEQRAQVLPKSPMAEAIGYALNNWTALIRYTEAGFLSIDNNLAEREMKRIAIGRKNWMHVGSDKGGQTAAVLFSFTSTCHRLGIEPWAYLKDVLARLPATLAERLGELLPDRWQVARQQAAAHGATSSTGSAPAADSAT